MSLTFKVLANQHLAAGEAAKAIAQLVQAQLADSVPVLLLLSGGSSAVVAARLPLSVYEHELVTTTVLDERYSSAFEHNNSLQLRQLEIPLTPFIPEKNESLLAFSQRFDSFLRQWRSDNPLGRVVALFGVGTDGHIAGISPFSTQDSTPTVLKEEIFAAGYTGTLEPPQRITVTPYFLTTQLFGGVVFMTGEHKREALVPILHMQEKNRFRYPVHQLQELDVELQVSCDFEVF